MILDGELNWNDEKNGIYASIKSIHNYIDQSESFKDKIVCNYNAWINIVK